MDNATAENLNGGYFHWPSNPSELDGNTLLLEKPQTWDAAH